MAHAHETVDESLMPSRLLLWLSLAGEYRNNITVAALVQLSCYLGCYNEPSCGRPYCKRTQTKLPFSASITSASPSLNKFVNFVLHKLLKCKRKCARTTSSWLLLLRHWGVASAFLLLVRCQRPWHQFKLTWSPGGTPIWKGRGCSSEGWN